jgi:hypothetical protein
MRKLFKLLAAALTIAFITAVVYAQSVDKSIESQNGSLADSRNNTPTDSARLAKIESAVRFVPSESEKKVTHANTQKASSFGKEQGSDTADLAQTQAPSEDAQALAKKLSNPISSLISVPFQNNFDFGMGPNKDGFRYTMNFQPVVPFALNKDWNLISRTIVPVIGQHNVVGTSTQFGLGDTVQSFFFSPNKSGPIIWGAGPVLLIPTATDKYLGSQKFGVGPTVVALTQQGKWTIGALFNHIWSVTGKKSRADVSSTFLQPFISYTTKSAWTITFNTESTYDWKGRSWGVPIHAQVTKLVMFGKQPVSLGGGLRCWATSPEGGPHWCGFRLVFVPMFPAK